ncbi:MAG: NAD(P)/FAD-dependent oxidoreductase [Thermodesulfobacteriota bacterium]
MADQIYDAIVIGGGTSGLTVANYLAKYGGLRTANFEVRPELGGGWGSEEAVPGFVANTHAAYVSCSYTQPLERDFPLAEKGFQYIPYQVASGAIFQEDHSSFCLYSLEADPSGERSAHTLARFSSKDADTWLWLWRLYKERMRDAILTYSFNPPPLPGVTSPLEATIEQLSRDWPDRLDPSLVVKSEIELFRELFESDTLIAGFCRLLHSASGTSPDVPGTGLGALYRLLLILPDAGTWRGGNHSLAHVLSRIFVEEGGRFFTGCEVDRVEIQGGRVTGIRLADGTQIKARQLVVSTLDPYTLCFRLIGKEHLDRRLARRVASLERWRICITWYGWAVHELPRYQAGAELVDINLAGRLALTSKDPEVMIRNHAWRRLGRMSPELSLSVWAHSSIDPTQAPAGKHVLGSEEFVLSAPYLSDDAWKQFKLQHAQDCIREWQRFAANMTWDNVIGYLPLTPLDATNCANFGPQGNWAVIDHIPSQMGSNRPVPELAQYRTPIHGLYATGAAWHRGGAGSCSAGYNCYKVIGQDLRLRRPWDGWAF